MGWLANIKKKKQRAERRDRRKAFRMAENQIDDVKDRIRQMEKEAKKIWEQARTAATGGQQAEQQRCLNSYRAAQVMMTKLEQKRWVFEQYLTKMQVAQSDHDFALALAAVNKVVNINPEQVNDVFEDAQELLGEQMDADRFWGKLYDKEMDGATGTLEDHIPSMAELTKQLEDEAAGSVSGSTQDSVRSDLDERIDTGLKEAQRHLENK